MTSTILGMFEQPIAARRAMEQLRNSSLTIEDISIISRATESGETVSSVDDVGAGEGAAVGAVWGGLVGLAALLIPGVGPFIALGALGATLTGAVTGAVVGGITAALIDFGDIPEAEARAYENPKSTSTTINRELDQRETTHGVSEHSPCYLEPENSSLGNSLLPSTFYSISSYTSSMVKSSMVMSG